LNGGKNLPQTTKKPIIKVPTKNTLVHSTVSKDFGAHKVNRYATRTREVQSEMAGNTEGDHIIEAGKEAYATGFSNLRSPEPLSLTHRPKEITRNSVTAMRR
jgi:hypothetical protein